MDTKMSQKTREEVLEKLRPRYARAGKKHKGKIINEVVQLFGYHRKAALRALRMKERPSVPHVVGRPKEYDPEKLAGPLKTIWLTAMQPCGERLKAALPEWLPAYETDHWRLDSDPGSLVGYGADRAPTSRHHSTRNAAAPADSHPHGMGRSGARIFGNGYGGPLRRRAG